MTMSGEYLPSALGWVSEQVERYEASGGREANTLRETGIPIVVVTMRGAKTGAVRKIALMRVEHEGEYAFVASYGGRPSNPGWYTNLLGAPDEVWLQDGPAPFPVSVREVHGDERDVWWQRSAAVFPTYNEYQAATERVIPVLVASPRVEGSAAAGGDLSTQVPMDVAEPPAQPATASPESGAPTDGLSARQLDDIAVELADVEAALSRLDAGQYWTDEITGGALGENFLAEHPTARSNAEA